MLGIVIHMHLRDFASAKSWTTSSKLRLLKSSLSMLRRHRQLSWSCRIVDRRSFLIRASLLNDRSPLQHFTIVHKQLGVIGRCRAVSILGERTNLTISPGKESMLKSSLKLRANTCALSLSSSVIMLHESTIT